MKRRSLQSCQNQIIKRRRKTSTTTTKSEEERNWLDLPRDVLLLIFLKLGVVEILVNAQRVCRWWWQLSKDPSLYRSVVIQGAADYFNCFPRTPRVRMLAKQAVDRSCGQLVKFHCHDCIKNIYECNFLQYLINQKFPLKSLALGHLITMPTIVLRPLMECLPLLEELHLELALYPQDLLQTIGAYCPNLKHLHLRYSPGHFRRTRSFKDPFVRGVIAIAENMPQLRRLHLINGLLVNKCLDAILAGCPLLEYLDLTGCHNLRMKGALLNKCLTRITTLILPNGSTYTNNNPNSSFTGSKLSVMHGGDGLLV